MSQPFVKIVNDKLSLVGSIPKGNPRVISILGKARMGKSTFLNSVVSHLRKESQAPFKAMDCDDHCTRGIDSFHMEDQNLLLLDSQGLDYEDASHDPHLLLLLYIISDVIIFNDTRRLENGALKLMEPVCAFTNYLDIDTVIKPRLFFRIFDSDVKDAAKNLEKVLGTYQDQYQSIRSSIKHLFHPDINLLKTEPLDRPAKIMLANKMYRELLNEPLGFREAIETILIASRGAEQKSVLSEVPSMIDRINSNQEISIEKLDVVKLQAENDIHKWIQENIPASVYTLLQVDGTQECYDRVVEPRKNEKKKLLTAFTKRFKDVEESIRGPFYKSLQEKMDEPIQKATDLSKVLARDLIKTQLTKAETNAEFDRLSSTQNSFTSVPDHYWLNYFGIFHTLSKSITSLYEPIRAEIQLWIKSILDTANLTMNEIRDIEKKHVEQVRLLLDEESKSIEEWMLSKIQNSITIQTVVGSNLQFLSILKEEKLKELDGKINELTSRLRVKFYLENKKLCCKKETLVNEGCPSGYDLISKFYWDFQSRVEEYIANTESKVNQELTEQKETFLYGKLLAGKVPLLGRCDAIVGWQMHPWTAKLIKSNPQIHFREDTVLGKYLQSSDFKSYNVMTDKTHAHTYMELYRQTLLDLAAKGYVKEDYGHKLIYDDDDEVNKGLESVLRLIYDDDEVNKGLESVLRFYKAETRYDEIVQDLFVKRLQKNYCKKTLEGFSFPEILDTDGVFKRDTNRGD